MPTFVSVDDAHQSLVVHPKIRISTDRLMEAFGGKSFYWTGCNEVNDDDDDEEDVGEYDHAGLPSSNLLLNDDRRISEITMNEMNSGATVSTISTALTHCRSFPRKAKEKESVIQERDDQEIELELVYVDGSEDNDQSLPIPNDVPTIYHEVSTHIVSSPKPKSKGPLRAKRVYKKKVKTLPKSPFLKAVNSSKGLFEEIISDLPNGVNGRYFWIVVVILSLLMRWIGFVAL
jgi:hypothetical protein